MIRTQLKNPINLECNAVEKETFPMDVTGRFVKVISLTRYSIRHATLRYINIDYKAQKCPGRLKYLVFFSVDFLTTVQYIYF